ncbi:hypothetical protein KAX02_08690 [candidate division WOR-3 bacterium]|nr:hypothetical protein [candidate division WOR-3 bacterium]
MSTAGITSIGVPQDIKQRSLINIQQNGNAQSGAKGYMPAAGDVVAVSFINDSAAAFAVTGALLKTGGATIIESTNNLADNTSERISSGLANNTGLAKAADLSLTTGAGAGAGATLAIVEIEYKLNAVV